MTTLGTEFARAAPWLEAALRAQDKRPLVTLADVRVDLEANQARLWAGERSCVVTTIADYPRTGERLIEAWLAAGAWDEIAAALPEIERWARAAGCTQARIEGRRGFERRLAPYGYEHCSTTLRKLLT